MITRVTSAPLALGLLPVAAAFLTACGSGSGSTSPSNSTTDGDGGAAAVSASGADVNETETNTAAVAVSVVPTSGTTVTNAFGELYQPAGCVTGSPSGSSASFTFNGCSGPWGLLHVSGMVNVSWSSNGPGGLQVKYAAENLQVNGATLSSWSGTAAVTGSGSSRTMAWSANLSGTTADGRSFSRTNNKSFNWTAGTGCLGESGTSNGNITGIPLEISVGQYQRCAGGCPAAGGEITVEDTGTGESLAIKYSGGSSAQVTGPDGVTATIALPCGG
jgi:hypothetical protein